jgi:hypothetical protein
MNFRFAKRSDYKILSQIHFECGKVQKGGFMHKLGKGFLNQYYKVYLDEKKSIILLAEDYDGNALGFSSGTTDASEHLENLRKNRIRFAFACLPALMKNPFLIRDILMRERYISSGEGSISFGVKSGPRGEYWAWRPDSKEIAGSGVLRQMWIDILARLGCKSFCYELDSMNTDIEKYKKIFNCRVVEELDLPDGRKRVIVEQSLKAGKAGSKF